MKKLVLMLTVAAFAFSASATNLKGDDKDKKDGAKKECSKDGAKSCCKAKEGKDAKACAKAGEAKSCHAGEKTAVAAPKATDKK